MIIGLVTCDPDTVAPSTCGYVVAIDPDMDLALGRTDESRVLRCALVHVSDIAMGRISRLGIGSAMLDSNSHNRRLTVQKLKRLKKELGA